MKVSAYRFGFRTHLEGPSLVVQSDSLEIIEHFKSVILPPGWMLLPVGSAIHTVLTISQSVGQYQIDRDDGWTLSSNNLDELIAAIAGPIHQRIALESDEIFVHAGVVALDGRSIILPGSSRAGKSTLVRALVEAGATYYSDEYAVINPHTCLVYPFARGLSLRHPEARIVGLAELGWQGVPPPVPVGHIFALQFRDAANWTVVQMTEGEAVLSLFQNTVAAQRWEEAALRTFIQALEGTQDWKGVRGDAGEAAHEIRGLLAETRKNRVKS